MFLLGVVGQSRGLGEGHEAVFAHERAVPGMKAQVVLQGRIGCELGATLLTRERLLIKVLCQLVVLHTCRRGSARDKTRASMSQVQHEDAQELCHRPSQGGKQNANQDTRLHHLPAHTALLPICPPTTLPSWLDEGKKKWKKILYLSSPPSCLS